MFYVENKLVLFTMKDLLLYFHSWGGSWKGEGEGEGRETHVPKSRRAAYCNKMECNKSYRTPECIDSLKIHID